MNIPIIQGLSTVGSCKQSPGCQAYSFGCNLTRLVTEGRMQIFIHIEREQLNNADNSGHYVCLAALLKHIDNLTLKSDIKCYS